MAFIYDLYDHNDIEANRRKRRFFFMWYFALLAAVLAASIAGLMLRRQIETIAITILGGALLIFLWDLAGSPVNRYHRYLKDLQSGLRREDTGVFRGWGNISARDGLYFYEMNVAYGEEERIYYVDARKTLPDLAEGDTITLTTHNKSAIIISKDGGTDG